MSPRPRHQCGWALMFNGGDKPITQRWCILDRWPRHKLHLFVDGGENLSAAERHRYLAKWHEWLAENPQ